MEVREGNVIVNVDKILTKDKEGFLKGITKFINNKSESRRKK
jgi:hypothetical protein